MALVTTTNSAAIGVSDNTITVASATSIAADRWIRVNGEFMKVAKGYVSGTTVPVLRGLEGTAAVAHAVTSNVAHGLAEDLGDDPHGVPDAIAAPSQPAFPIKAYGVAGAIDARQHIAVINGTGALAMTLAAPAKDQDGEILIIVANGKAAHTVTATGGFGANTTNSDVMTMHATQTTAFMAVACNGVWVLIGFVAGAATVAGSGLA